jgi:multiple sugar transport system ATP-binding protein
MATVRLEHVTRRFGTTAAVEDLSLDVRDKELLILLGPSGCGKTTTLNMIAGLDVPTEGHIYIDDQPVERVPPDRRDIAMVFQTIALYPHLAVYDNIAFPLRMAKRPKAEIDRKVRETAQLVRIDHLLDRKPNQLSGGERQRTALGRAVVRNPKIFLFDEPLSSLDAKLRVEMRIEIKKLHERLKATFIYVTHDQVEAHTMADRIVAMSRGKIQQVGTPREMYTRPVNRFVAGFLGSPGMNFIEGRLAPASGGLRFEAPGFTLALPAERFSHLAGLTGRPLTLGVRPEALGVTNSSRSANTVEAVVFATEPVGSDLFMDVTFGENGLADGPLFKVRTRPDLEVREGERIGLVVPHDQVYLFGEEGERVHPAEGWR